MIEKKMNSFNDGGLTYKKWEIWFLKNVCDPKNKINP